MFYHYTTNKVTTTIHLKITHISTSRFRLRHSVAILCAPRCVPSPKERKNKPKLFVSYRVEEAPVLRTNNTGWSFDSTTDVMVVQRRFYYFTLYVLIKRIKNKIEEIAASARVLICKSQFQVLHDEAG